jgi:hydrogenase-4 component F
MRRIRSDALLNIAFVFLLLGYGTKVGWRRCTPGCPTRTPKARRRSRRCCRVCCSTSRCTRAALQDAARANANTIAPGPLMMGLGLLSLIFAAFMLYRRRDIKRLFAYSSIEHMGIIVFAFGIGGPLANFAGLLHMTMHSLTKSAIFFTVGHIAQAKGTQRIADIRGLTVSHPVLGWSLALGVLAIAGAPPLGIFTSEFLVVSSTFARAPWLALLLVAGLLLAFGALIAPAGHGVRRAEPGRQALDGLDPADRRPSRPGRARRALSAAAAGRLVPARRGDVALGSLA